MHVFYCSIVPIRDSRQISALWGVRKAAVGLLGKSSGGRSGLAFVEDVAVPPERLADFVDGFRQILHDNGLASGMYGHADVGCVHVRPLMDLSKSEHRRLIRVVSEATAKLAASHGGLLWGEHGKGFRSEYLEDTRAATHLRLNAGG